MGTVVGMPTITQIWPTKLNTATSSTTLLITIRKRGINTPLYMRT